MAESSKQKPTTGSSKSHSNATKAARRKRLTDYKNSKASAVALSVKGKGIQYYDEDDDNGKNDDSNKDNDNNVNNGDNDEGGSSQDNGRDNANKDSHVEAAPAPKPFKSKRPAIRRVQDSEEEASEGEPEPTKVSKPVSSLSKFPIETSASERSRVIRAFCSSALHFMYGSLWSGPQDVWGFRTDLL